MPALEFASLPSRDEIALFAPAQMDALNPGVFRPDGSRLPPLYKHHVDDEYYCDVLEHMPRTVSASIIALYEILGYPQRNVPPVLSFDKLVTLYNHLRVWNGFLINSRSMDVDVLPHKREQAISDIELWLVMANFTLTDAAKLVGTIESFSRFSKWGRAWFYALQNAIRTVIKLRYNVASRMMRRSGKRQRYADALPSELRSRVDHLVGRDIADFIWATGIRISMTEPIRQCISCLLQCLKDPLISWATPIGFIVPRVPHVESAGDASHDAGGGLCALLNFWFDIIWSAELRRRCRLPHTDPDYIHINVLEFIVVIVQFAAFIVRMDTLSPVELEAIFPNGPPVLPILLVWTDNTASKSWAHRVTTKSVMGQQFVGIYAQLLRLHKFGINTDHIAGVLNTIPDYISRPTHDNLSHAERSEQIFLAHPSLRTYDYFLPSAELLQLLSSALYTKPTVALPALPKTLGRIVRAGSTISCSPML